MADQKDTPHYHGHRSRLRQRFLLSEESNFADYELLELILFYVYPRRDVKPLAKQLLAYFGSFTAVIHASAGELQKAGGGSSETLNAFFKVLQTTAKRLIRTEIIQKELLNSWEKVIAYCRLQSSFSKVEEFRLLFLDKKLRLITDELIQRGTVDSTAVYPREVVKWALELGAFGVIMVHNHPSGDPHPSSADVEVTKRIIEALKPLAITVYDHVIIGKGTHFSMKSAGLM